MVLFRPTRRERVGAMPCPPMRLGPKGQQRDAGQYPTLAARAPAADWVSTSKKRIVLWSVNGAFRIYPLMLLLISYDAVSQRS